jgi:putative ABC transport system permease protein
MVLGTISGLLMLTTGLGIFGLATFSVAKRRKQIGTRRALGASQLDIVWHFLTENLLITSSGIVLGLILGLGLNFVLTMMGLNRINPGAVLACIAFIALLGVAAVLVPALKAARVPPAVATRTV